MFRRLSLLALALAVACRSSEPVPARATTSAPSRPPPPRVAAGSLRAASAKFSYGVYFLPAPRIDPERALATSCNPIVRGFRRVEKPEAPSPERPDLWIRRSDQSSFADTAPEVLEKFTVALSIADQHALRHSEPALVLTVSASRPQITRALRLADELAGCVARSTAGAVYDFSTAQVFSADAWQYHRVATWRGAVVNAPAHMVIHEYADGELMREVTLGQEKLALPDLVVEQVSRHASSSMSGILNLTAQTLVEHDTLATPSRLPLSLEGSAGAHHADVSLAWGKGKPGDADNRLLELRFDVPDGGSAQEQRDALVAAMGGAAPDVVVRVEHDPELLAATALARRHLAALKPRFERGLEPGENLLVKAPFRTPSGGNEWMWIEVTSWNDNTIGGILANDPSDVRGLRSGAHVTTPEASVFDYLFRHGEEHEGNETEPLLRQRQR